MRVVSFNVEGIFSAEANGFFEWIKLQDADVVCLQDLRASINDLHLPQFKIEGYSPYFFENYIADDKSVPGGVAIYSRIAPKAVITEIGSPDNDGEGRYIQADFNNISIGSLLVPGEVNSADLSFDKYSFLDAYLLFLKKQSRKRREVITCGTFNIAHTPKDVACYENFKNAIGALPNEQKWFSHLLDQMHYVDCYREIETKEGLFSFWNTEEDRANNMGWRIDYQIATRNIRPLVVSAGIYTRTVFSRHAPIIVDYECDLSV